MSEYLSDEHEQPAVCRLRSEFHLKGGSYTDMFFILQDYIEKDLSLSSGISERELLRLESIGVLPSSELYDSDPVAALEKHRLAMYTTWMPRYQLNHTSEEFEEWLPYALQIVLPVDGRHEDEICSAYPYREAIHDESCYISLQCPIRHIGNDVVYGLCHSSMDTVEYLLDPEKACRNTQLLISGVAQHGIISATAKAAAEAAYLRRYNQEFPKPDLSQ